MIILGSSVYIYVYVLSLIAPVSLEGILARLRAPPRRQKDLWNSVSQWVNMLPSMTLWMLRHVPRLGQLPILNPVWSVESRAHQLPPTPPWAFRPAKTLTAPVFIPHSDAFMECSLLPLQLSSSHESLHVLPWPATSAFAHLSLFNPLLHFGQGQPGMVLNNMFSSVVFLLP